MLVRARLLSLEEVLELDEREIVRLEKGEEKQGERGGLESGGEVFVGAGKERRVVVGVVFLRGEDIGM